MAVRAIAPQQPSTTFQCFPCDWANKLAQFIYDLAMKIFDAIKDVFRPAPVGVETRQISRERVIASSSLTGFYLGVVPNINDVTLDQILSWDDDRLERVPNYIQWLFPTDCPDESNPTAPILDGRIIRIFRTFPILKNQVLRSFSRMLTFYGLQSDQNQNGRIIRGPNFAPRLENLLTNPHHFERISQMMYSLDLLGLHREKSLLYDVLVEIAMNEGHGRIPQEILDEWQRLDLAY